MADFTTSDSTSARLAELYRRGGRFSTVYADVTADTSFPRGVTDAQRRAIGDALEGAGAPDADRSVIDVALDGPSGVGGPVSRFLVVRDGTIEIDELLPGEPLAERMTSYGPIPRLLPLFAHRPRDLTYCVVEAGRDGGEIRLFRLGTVQPVSERMIEGDDQYITKVQAGGWSHKRYQRDAEEIWKRNETELAAAIDDIVQEEEVELLLVAGDIRARQLLEGQLAPASREVLVVVPVNTRADGASTDALDREVEIQLTALLARDENDALERLAAGAGQSDRLAEFGIGAVVHALQQGQAEALVLERGGVADRTLIALDAEPWIAVTPEEALGAGETGVVAAADALVRAAVLTDARVILVDDGLVPDRAEVAALLRWPTGPAQPS